MLPVTAGPHVFFVLPRKSTIVGSYEHEGSARTMALKEAKSEVVMAAHSVSVTTFAVRPRVPIVSEYSSYSKTSTKRTSSARTEVARLANRPTEENFMISSLVMEKTSEN
jgi:hypothetical protein